MIILLRPLFCTSYRLHLQNPQINSSHKQTARKHPNTDIWIQLSTNVSWNLDEKVYKFVFYAMSSVSIYYADLPICDKRLLMLSVAHRRFSSTTLYLCEFSSDVLPLALHVHLLLFPFSISISPNGFHMYLDLPLLLPFWELHCNICFFAPTRIFISPFVTLFALVSLQNLRKSFLLFVI